MQELSMIEIEQVSGGETADQRHEIAVGIMTAGIVLANPGIFLAGVVYAMTK